HFQRFADQFSVLGYDTLQTFDGFGVFSFRHKHAGYLKPRALIFVPTARTWCAPFLFGARVPRIAARDSQKSHLWRALERTRGRVQ
ncbi:MAG: hypothetical protein E7A86_30180, partial [Bradyrhizobium sp.]|nr:hypothetical protein [Bradyrhizobium sp.]